MTITDLKKYAECMNAQYSPLDRMQVTLRREALSYIGAFLRDRHCAICKVLADPKTKPSKRANREMKKAMLEESIKATNNPTMLTAFNQLPQ